MPHNVTLQGLRYVLREAVSLRARLTQPQQPQPLRFGTCAVVGSSGSLMLDRFGGEIDAHDVVIRFNSAPVLGYEEIAGSKTTVRLLNSQAMISVLRRCSPLGTCAWNRTCCAEELVVINSGRPEIVSCYKRVCGDTPNVRAR